MRACCTIPRFPVPCRLHFRYDRAPLTLERYTSFEPDRLLSRLECFAHWQSHQSPPDGAGSGHAIYITMEPCSCTVSPLHGIVHRGATICVLSAHRRFSPFARHHLRQPRQPTVLFPTSSVLIGRPVRSSEHMRRAVQGLWQRSGRLWPA